VLARVDRCGSGRIDLGCRVRGGHEHRNGPICRCVAQRTSPVTLLQGVNREFLVRLRPAVLRAVSGRCDRGPIPPPLALGEISRSRKRSRA
jgi:hypothetical protein